MSKLKIEDIKKEIENKGWTLLSTSYINLKTDLEMICPENHNCLVSYGQWRKDSYECPICKQNQYYKIEKNYISKKGYRTLVLDQASITSGWAVFDDQQLISYGSNTSDGSSSTEKIAKTKYWVASLIDKWNPDEIVIEDIQLQERNNSENYRDMGVTTYKILAHLQGVLMNYFYEKNIRFKTVPPATWRSHSEIKGKYRNDKKKNAQIKVKKFYDISVSEDEADAILIGRWATYVTSKNQIIDF